MLKINDVWCDDDQELQRHARDYFLSLFTPQVTLSQQQNTLAQQQHSVNLLPHSLPQQPQVTLPQQQNTLAQQQHSVNLLPHSLPQQLDRQHLLPLSPWQCSLQGEMIEKLEKQMDIVELKHIIWSTHPYKAPGPDGLQGIFYRQCWDWLHISLLEFMQMTFATRYIPKEVCEAYMCLIPKIPNPSIISQFRPISLCNVLYKLITKCITMRLQDSMPELIAPAQSSFIKGRSTQDNIILMQELLHSTRSQKTAKFGSMFLKLDLEKAYDKVNWDFLEETLNVFGFPTSIIDLIMCGVRNASTRILWNGQALESFDHQCGLRQGDPLSPYLFVLCIERLGYLIDRKSTRLNSSHAQ